MSDVREVNEAHRSVGNDLARRRELKRMTKPDLISCVVRVENSLEELADRLELAYGDEP